MKLGFIGLGKMGSRMVQKLIREGHEVVVWNRSESTISNFKFQISNSQLDQKKLEVADSIEDLIKRLSKPRVVWVMVTAGKATEQILSELSKYVQTDDIVIDGGNSFYKDTERRFQDFRNKGIRFLGIGVSGGIVAAEQGYPMMVGGDKSAYEYIKPVLDSLAKPAHSASSGQGGGHEYFGTGGAGHFVKMIHNGIEYGIMQSLGEGFAVLEKAPYQFDLLKIAKLWQKGTLASGFMLDRVVDVLSQDAKLEHIEGYIEESGEARWTIEQAKEEKVPVEIIERSLEYRKRSKTDKTIQKSFTAKLIAALRQAFGGHEVKMRD